MSDPQELSADERAKALSRTYSEGSGVYEELWASGLRRMGRELLERMDIATAKRVLDAGAGVGALLPDIAELAPSAHVVGSDLADGMIARAASRYGRCIGDATALPFAHASFDAVTFTFMLFHLPHPVDGLEEAHRVLAPGGRVGCATWADEEEWPVCGVWNEELDRAGAEEGAPLLSQHELVDTPEKMAMHLRAARFRDVQTWEGILERRWDIESFVSFATGMATPKRRLDTLAPERREPFLRSATERIAGLPAGAFTSRSAVVFAIASR